MDGIMENYAALAVAILSPRFLTVEVAFMVYEKGPRPKRGGHLREAWTDQDCEDVIRLKGQGLTWPELGEVYGIKRSAMIKRMQTYRNRKIKSA
ncbi:hypothetical protein JR334_01950 [Clostridia bacterium]|nr:hypothetical protein JR334_01950 [Clostridia bacterium]